MGTSEASAVSMVILIALHSIRKPSNGITYNKTRRADVGDNASHGVAEYAAEGVGDEVVDVE